MVEEIKITIDHDEIRKWAEARGGKPELIDDFSSGSDPIGIRINFPGARDDIYFASDKHPKPVTWGEFFERFEELGLAFMYENNKDKDALGVSYGFIKRKNI